MYTLTIPCWTDSQSDTSEKNGHHAAKRDHCAGQRKWSYPAVLVPKPDESWRFCIDYRRLNAITIRDTYSILMMDDCADFLGEATWFSTLSASSG